MAVLATTHPTLLDLSRVMDPNGKVTAVVEILNETNEILTDMVWQEGNLITGHRTSIRSGLPRRPGASSTAASSRPSPAR